MRAKPKLNSFIASSTPKGNAHFLIIVYAIYLEKSIWKVRINESF